jgi:hypothetical protein
MIVPQTEFDVAGTLIPLPAVAKLMKKGKFRKISKAMHVEDPANAAGIIAKQADKHVSDADKLAKKEYDEYMKGELNRIAEPPKAEVRAIDEKEMLQRADRRNAEEKRYLQQYGKSEKEIEKLIKEKYGIEGDNWSAVDSEADQEFGISDLSGKKGDVIEITDGEQTLQVLSDEYLDIMGLSGAIPIDETPFAQAMKTKKPKVGNPKSVEPTKGPKGKQTKQQRLEEEEALGKAEKERWGKILKDEEEIDAAKNQQAIDEALKKIQDRKNKPKIVDPPKGPKGDPEASLPRQPDKFAAIRSQLDVAPSRMDDRGKAFGDVGQSDFTPYDRPSPQFEEIQKRNYVERDADPKEKLWKEIVANDPYLPDSPEYLQNLRNYFDNRWEQAQGTAEGGQMRMDLPKADRVKPGADLGVTSRYVDELAFKKFAKPYEKTRQSERPILGPNDRTHKIDDKITDYFEGYEVQTPGRKLQNEMYKGRPSHEAEQAKLFPKVKEAVKGKAQPKSGPGYTQGRYHVKDWAGNDMPQFGTYDDMEEAIEGVYDHFRKQGLDDEALDEVLEDLTVQERKGWKPSKKVTKEESDRLLEEKLKDF